MRLAKPLWVVVAACLGPIAAATIFPGFSDEQLSTFPTIVIGYWPRAPRDYHTERHGDTTTKLETRTQLVVTRVLRGEIGPRRYPLLYSYGSTGATMDEA